MRFVAVSDTHLSEPSLPEGDVLIHAGDLTFQGDIREISQAARWLHDQKLKKKYKYVIVIAGNHDWLFQSEPALAREIMREHGFIYLEDEQLTIDVQEAVIGEIVHGPGRITIYGSPWQPEFMNWAFNLPRGGPLREKWDMIPAGLDILITHGPPYRILDGVPTVNEPAYPGERTGVIRHVGCQELLKAVERVRPKVHVFGHIHASHGRTEKDGTLFINASVMNEEYDPEWSSSVFDLS